MKIKSEKKNENVFFENFCVIKESEHFFAVYERITYSYSYFKTLLTSGTTLSSACKKAKLLQMGYNFRKEYEY